jgi:hypothetical protein
MVSDLAYPPDVVGTIRIASLPTQSGRAEGNVSMNYLRQCTGRCAAPPFLQRRWPIAAAAREAGSPSKPHRRRCAGRRLPALRSGRAAGHAFRGAFVHRRGLPLAIFSGQIAALAAGQRCPRKASQANAPNRASATTLLHEACRKRRCSSAWWRQIGRR